MTEDKNINFKPVVQVEDFKDVVTPPPPGNHQVVKKSQERPRDPKMSPHYVEGEQPVWISCRATPECGGNYAVQTITGEMGLEGGGGNWIRYKCLTCGGRFHITR